jgi:hypothetical protein
VVKDRQVPVEHVQRLKGTPTAMSKLRFAKTHLAGPALAILTVFALGAPVKWCVVVQALGG